MGRPVPSRCSIRSRIRIANCCVVVVQSKSKGKSRFAPAGSAEEGEEDDTPASRKPCCCILCWHLRNLTHTCRESGLESIVSHAGSHYWCSVHRVEYSAARCYECTSTSSAAVSTGLVLGDWMWGQCWPQVCTFGKCNLSLFSLWIQMVKFLAQMLTSIACSLAPGQAEACQRIVANNSWSWVYSRLPLLISLQSKSIACSVASGAIGQLEARQCIVVGASLVISL